MARYTIRIEGAAYEVTVTEAGGRTQVTVEDRTFEVEVTGAPAPATVATASAPPLAAPPPRRPPTSAAGTDAGAVHAPIPGVITRVLVKVGDQVRAGQVVVKLEAMKMENDIACGAPGTVTEVAVAEGSEVRDGQLLVVVG